MPPSKPKQPLNANQKSLKIYLVTLERCVKAGDRRGEMEAHEHIGASFETLGFHARSMQSYTKLLKLAQEVK